MPASIPASTMLSFSTAASASTSANAERSCAAWRRAVTYVMIAPSMPKSKVCATSRPPRLKWNVGAMKKKFPTSIPTPVVMKPPLRPPYQAPTSTAPK